MTSVWPIGRPPHWVGRARELAILSAAVEGLRGGVGSVLWIEGEPGIGKSSLVAEAVAEHDSRWDIGWGMADQLNPIASCNTVTAHYLRVFPPNQLAPLYLALTTPTCSNTTQILTVSAVRAGAGDAS